MTLAPTMCGINTGTFDGSAINDCQRLVRVVVQGRDMTERGKTFVRQKRVAMLLAPRDWRRPSLAFDDMPAPRVIRRRRKASAETVRVTLDWTAFLRPGEEIDNTAHEVVAVTGTPVDVVGRTSNGPFGHTVDFLVSGGSAGSESELRLSAATNQDGRARVAVRFLVGA